MKAVEYLALSLFLSFYLLHFEKKMMRMTMRSVSFFLVVLMMILTLRRHYFEFCYFVDYSRLRDWCRMGLFLTHECHDDSVKKEKKENIIFDWFTIQNEHFLKEKKFFNDYDNLIRIMCSFKVNM